MTPKHTPGPWLAEAHQTYGYRGKLTPNILINPIVIGKKRNIPIAKIPRDGGEEALANARVMASSPELLSLVTQALAGFDKYQLVPGGDFARWVIEARAVVAKVVGEQAT